MIVRTNVRPQPELNWKCSCKGHFLPGHHLCRRHAMFSSAIVAICVAIFCFFYLKTKASQFKKSKSLKRSFNWDFIVFFVVQRSSGFRPKSAFHTTTTCGLFDTKGRKSFPLHLCVSTRLSTISFNSLIHFAPLCLLWSRKFNPLFHSINSCENFKAVSMAPWNNSNNLAKQRSVTPDHVYKVHNNISQHWTDWMKLVAWNFYGGVHGQTTCIYCGNDLGSTAHPHLAGASIWMAKNRRGPPALWFDNGKSIQCVKGRARQTITFHWFLFSVEMPSRHK